MTHGALLARCPVCNAGPGQPCTAPTSTGRRKVQWFHFRREDK